MGKKLLTDNSGCVNLKEEREVDMPVVDHFQQLTSRVGTLESNYAEILAELRDINERLGAYDERFDEIDKRLDSHDEKFVSLGDKLDLIIKHLCIEAKDG